MLFLFQCIRPHPQNKRQIWTDPWTGCNCTTTRLYTAPWWKKWKDFGNVVVTVKYLLPSTCMACRLGLLFHLLDGDKLI